MGDSWGGYALIEMLGEGEMGRVYRAKRHTDQQEFAIKMLPPLREGDIAARRLLRREGEILAQLVHPSIVRFDGFVEEEGRFALVMELLRGPTLQAKLLEGPLAPDITLSLLLDILEALDHAHRQGVIHRDLKPSNLFLVETRQSKAHDPILHVKIGGFGVARMRFEQLSSTLGQHVGEAVTVQYLAPEQLEDISAVDARSDLYALGVIAYETLVGERMIDGIAHLHIIQQILRDPRPPLHRGLLDRLPSGFDDWHQTLLAKAPNDRFPNAQKARDALLSLLHHPSPSLERSAPSLLTPPFSPSQPIALSRLFSFSRSIAAFRLFSFSRSIAAFRLFSLSRSIRLFSSIKSPCSTKLDGAVDRAERTHQTSRISRNCRL